MSKEVGITIDFACDEFEYDSVSIRKEDCSKEDWENLKEMVETKMSYELEDVVRGEIEVDGDIYVQSAKVLTISNELKEMVERTFYMGVIADLHSHFGMDIETIRKSVLYNIKKFETTCGKDANEIMNDMQLVKFVDSPDDFQEFLL